MRIEPLSPRLPMTVEGAPHAVDYTLDVSELMGTVSGTIAWGDGTSSAATIASTPAPGPLKVRLDYTYDTGGFFQSTTRRALLQTVVDSVIRRFSDSLSAIQPTGSDRWEAKFKNPATGTDITRTNMVIAANELVIFVGARVLSSGEGGLGDRGGYSVSSTRQQFVDAVRGRGQAGALTTPQTDVGPWGGAIAFDTTKNWYFGTDESGLGANQMDFVSVAAHEFLHVLGFGTTNSFETKISNGFFVGASAVAEYGGNVPMQDADHFANNLTYRGSRPIMVASFANGERLLPTRLDLAAMHDIGWRLIAPSARITGSSVYGDNGSFSAFVTLQGSSIGEKTYPFTAVITNEAPTFVARGNANGTAGQPITLNRIGQFTDPGYGIATTTPPRTETFTYRIQWGDNTSDTGNAIVESVGNASTDTRGYFNGTHTYTNAGTYTVTLTATDDDGGSSTQQFQIVVAPPPQLTVSIAPATFSEAGGAGVATLTIVRPAAFANASVVILLASSDTTEASLPANVTMAAGVTTTTVGVNAVDDALFDGSQSVEFTASATGFLAGRVSATVTDYQPLSLAAPNTALNEDVVSLRSTQVTVGLRSPAPVGGARVNLAASVPGILQFPSSVTIPAGATQTVVTVTAVDDLRPQRLRDVTLSASGTNVISATLPFTVTDTDPFRWTNPILAEDTNGNGTLEPLDVLIVINEINRAGSRVLDPATDLTPPYFDANPDGRIDPLDVLVIINRINQRG